MLKLIKICFVLLFTPLLWAQVPQEADILSGKNDTDDVAVVDRVSSESGKDLSLIHIYLNKHKELGKLSLEDHGDFFQLKLPHTITMDPGKFYEIQSPYIQKIAIFQLTPTESSIRIFLNKNVQGAFKSADIQALDNKITMTFDHRAISLSPNFELKSENKPLDSLTAPTVAPDPFDIKIYLQKITFFSAALILFLLAVITYKKKFSRKMFAKNRIEPISMDVISRLQLSPKQKLIVIEVLGEKMLLSMTNDHVQLITKFTQKSEMPSLPDTISPHAYLQGPVYTQPTPTLSAPAPKPVKEDKENSNERRQLFLNQLKETMKNKQNSPKPPPPPADTTENKTNNEHKGKRVNYAISDDGIQDKRKNKTKDDEKAINDVSKLIREKLKFLPRTG